MRAMTDRTAPETTSADIVGIVLSAGAGRRFLTIDHERDRRPGHQPGHQPDDEPVHKLTAILRGRRVVDWALDAALGAGLAGVVVVTGAVALELPAGVIEVHNDRWADGQATSLHLGVQAAADQGADAVVVGLGDQPFVTADAWAAVARSTAAIAVATYGGVRGNPVRLHRSVWPMLPITGDEGARRLMALRPELVSPVACNGSAADIDTMEDLRQWNSSTNSP